ncbi:MAG: hypothetical protein CL663_00885 [Bacteroidetes bacterium]|nr:hypothetical protein [Bacteroidota bacterium]|tara:strand:+ start:148 stop:783 length:636 start_codon:yes stop_codon:yes gene_type:complete
MRPLIQEKFAEAYGNLRNWRETVYSISNSKDPKNGILPFVAGLRFSAQIIYIARKILSDSGLKVDWGHIINDDDETYCNYSNECDIIIYKAQINNVAENWNGDDRTNPVMNFKFVNKSAVVAVISCKSMINKSNIDKNYPEQVKDYVSEVWLFSECCGPRSIDSVRNEAISSGYSNFWPLYTWSPKSSSKEYKDGWEDFNNKLLALAQSVQ